MKTLGKSDLPAVCTPIVTFREHVLFSFLSRILMAGPPLGFRCFTAVLGESSKRSYDNWGEFRSGLGIGIDFLDNPDDFIVWEESGKLRA